MNNFKRFGQLVVAFTLAEVLITLGIIGVVAAMTIPNLITKIQGNQYRVKFQKAVSSLNQAVKLNKTNFDWDFADINGTNDINDINPETSKTMFALLSGSVKGITLLQELPDYMKKDANNARHVAAMANYWGFDDGAAIQMPDGIMFGFIGTNTESCHFEPGTTLEQFVNGGFGADDSLLDSHSECLGYIDINGMSPPNAEVVCAGFPEEMSESFGMNSQGYVVMSRTDPCNDVLMGDQFPVVYHDGTVEPVTNAAKAVLSGANVKGIARSSGS